MAREILVTRAKKGARFAGAVDEPFGFFRSEDSMDESSFWNVLEAEIPVRNQQFLVREMRADMVAQTLRAAQVRARRDMRSDMATSPPSLGHTDRRCSRGPSSEF
jgi:hypothetical protein